MTKKTHAEVIEASPLTDSILKLVLKPKHYIDYFAGQYLQIHHEGESICYSIANAPLGAHQYELHVRHHSNNPAQTTFLTQLQKQGEVEISLPYGQCHIQALKLKKMIFLAAGTGFAPIKAMIEHLLANGNHHPFELIWCARSRSDLYMDEKVLHWQQHVTNFHYSQIITSDNKCSLAEQCFKRHGKDLNDWQIILSGPFEMMHKNRDELLEKGALAENLFSDAFYQ